MTDLAAWLFEQIAEDERRARAVMESGSHPGDLDGTDRWVAGGSGIVTERFKFDVLLGPWDYTDDRLSSHVVTWQPARVLAECDAKRRIAEMWVGPEKVRNLSPGVHDGRDADEVEAQVQAAEAIDQVVRIHAAVYAAQGRPGYREEWRP